MQPKFTKQNRTDRIKQKQESTNQPNIRMQPIQSTKSKYFIPFFERAKEERERGRKKVSKNKTVPVVVCVFAPHSE